MCKVWSRSTYLLPSYNVLLLIPYLYLTLHCNLDLWPWTFLMYCLWRDETMYHIWAKSNNPRRRYCDLNDLEHVSRAPQCSGIILTNFKLSQPIRSWNITIFMLPVTRYVTLWPWPLIRWPWTFVVHQVSRGQGIYEIWAKSNNPWLSCRRF